MQFVWIAFLIAFLLSVDFETESISFEIEKTTSLVSLAAYTAVPCGLKKCSHLCF